jgi:hypothetical protein
MSSESSAGNGKSLKLKCEEKKPREKENVMKNAWMRASFSADQQIMNTFSGIRPSWIIFRIQQRSLIGKRRAMRQKWSPEKAQDRNEVTDRKEKRRAIADPILHAVLSSPKRHQVNQLKPGWLPTARETVC